MLTARALLVPHLPTLLVDEHRGHRTEMLQALEQASERFLTEAPAVIVALSARWESPEPFLVDNGKKHGTITDYVGFGVEVRYDCLGHPGLARKLAEAGSKAGVRVGLATRGVDSGISVPLHFLVPMRSLPVVPLSLSRRSAAECRKWGSVIRQVLAAWPERAAFVVGGLLSHNEHAWTMRRDVPESGELDERALNLLRQGDWAGLGAFEPRLVERAEPEAGLRHLEVLRGFLSSDARGEVLCYEASPGVGAALIEFPVVEAVETAGEAP